MTKTEIKAMATKACGEFNPYIIKAIKFSIDRIEHYIYVDKIMTREEIDNAYIDTAMRDIQCGYNDRVVGYYDKWYRYNHADEGRAYDIGVREATKSPKCPEGFHIIECMH